MDTIIVAGIARQGLTVTMQMLDSGGYPCYGKHPSYEEGKRVYWDNVPEGVAVKAVNIVHNLPPPGAYRVIIPSRDIKQQIKSIQKYRKMLGESAYSNRVLRKAIKHNKQLIYDWSKAYNTLIYKFEDLMNTPLEVCQLIARWVGDGLDPEAMAKVVIDRSPECYPTMLEEVL